MIAFRIVMEGEDEKFIERDISKMEEDSDNSQLSDLSEEENKDIQFDLLEEELKEKPPKEPHPLYEAY